MIIICSIVILFAYGSAVVILAAAGFLSVVGGIAGLLPPLEQYVCVASDLPPAALVFAGGALISLAAAILAAGVRFIPAMFRGFYSETGVRSDGDSGAAGKGT